MSLTHYSFVLGKCFILVREEVNLHIQYLHVHLYQEEICTCQSSLILDGRKKPENPEETHVIR